jgi:hypothetical protein
MAPRGLVLGKGVLRKLGIPVRRVDHYRIPTCAVMEIEGVVPYPEAVIEQPRTRRPCGLENLGEVVLPDRGDGPQAA